MGSAFAIPGVHALAHTIITDWAKAGSLESSTEAWPTEIPVNPAFRKTNLCTQED